MPRRVICISYSSGAGGENVGRLVSERLRLRYLDDQIVLRAAADGRVSPEALLDAERRKSAISGLFSQFRETALSSGGAPSVPDVTEAHRGLIRSAIHAAADEGDAVIVAHAASLTLGPRPDVLRVLVTASLERREARVAEELDTDAKQAGRVVRKSDAGRAAYLKAFHCVDEELPTHYDLVVNTDTLTEEQAADLVAAAAG